MKKETIKAAKWVKFIFSYLTFTHHIVTEKRKGNKTTFSYRTKGRWYSPFFWVLAVLGLLVGLGAAVYTTSKATFEHLGYKAQKYPERKTLWSVEPLTRVEINKAIHS